MTELITAVEAADVRFPTSLHLDGSDAMNPGPDYSGAYVTIRTSAGGVGHALAFTVGRGNDVQVAAVRAVAELVVGLRVDDVQHLAMFDYVAVAGTWQDRVIEYVDHLHEHFTVPARIRRGRCLAPVEPGLNAELHPGSVAAHLYPQGAVWQEATA